MLDLLLLVDEDAATTIGNQGKLHGHCCFCMSALRDDRSTEAGYGPQCASNWGLPWGKKK